MRRASRPTHFCIDVVHHHHHHHHHPLLSRDTFRTRARPNQRKKKEVEDIRRRLPVGIINGAEQLHQRSEDFRKRRAHHVRSHPAGGRARLFPHVQKPIAERDAAGCGEDDEAVGADALVVGLEISQAQDLKTNPLEESSSETRRRSDDAVADSLKFVFAQRFLDLV
jgi:hypothetical protein